MVTAALIGVAGFGRMHCADLLRLHERGEVQIAAATVRDESKAPERVEALRAAGAAIFRDHREMLDKLRGQIDLCFIPTGIHLHEPMTLDALSAGANVFVEKPAAATLGQVRRMQAAETAAGRFVAVGYQTMYAPETMVMKRAILDGTIGALQAIKCIGLWPRPDPYYDNSPWIGTIRREGTWILDSPFNNAFAHQLNMIAFLAGTESERTAVLRTVEAELYHARSIETADTATIRLTTADGVPLYFLVSHASGGIHNPEIVVRGTRGSIHWTPERLTIMRGDAVIVDEACLTGTDLRDAMLAAVLARRDDPSRFISTLETASAQTLAANGAHLSSAVRQIPLEFIARLPHEATMRTAIIGLDQLMERCFDEEKLLSEAGAPWGAAGRPVALDPDQVAAAYPD